MPNLAELTTLLEGLRTRVQEVWGICTCGVLRTGARLF